jgi:hypothetical protein
MLAGEKKLATGAFYRNILTQFYQIFFSDFFFIFLRTELQKFPPTWPILGGGES